MADKMKHVLDGYKVLDFTQFLAGPTVTRMMAEMGAEIIKVEIAPIGDFSRGLPFMHDGRSAYYIQQNRGKKSLCIDVKKPGGLEILKDLVRGERDPLKLAKHRHDNCKSTEAELAPVRSPGGRSFVGDTVARPLCQ